MLVWKKTCYFPLLSSQWKCSSGCSSLIQAKELGVLFKKFGNKQELSQFVKCRLQFIKQI